MTLSDSSALKTEKVVSICVLVAEEELHVMYRPSLPSLSGTEGKMVKV